MQKQPKDSETEEIDNGKPILTRGVLGARINLEYAKPFQHKSPVLKPGFNSMIVAGASGTGKSTFVLSILPFFARLNNIVYATRMPNTDLFDAIARWCAATPRDPLPPGVGVHPPKKKDQQAALGTHKDGDKDDEEDGPRRIGFHVVNNPGDLMKVCEPIANEQKSGRDQGYWSIVIMDDFSQHRGPSDPYRQACIQVCSMLRNCSFHNITISQAYCKMVDPSIRTSANNFVCFPIFDKFSRTALLQDLSPLNKEFTAEGVRYLYDEICGGTAHGYLWCVLDGGKARLYRYIDDSTGLQRVITPAERQRQHEEESSGAGGEHLTKSLTAARIAKLRALKEEHRRAVNEKNHRLAAALYRRIDRLSEKAQAGASSCGYIAQEDEWNAD